MKKNVDEIERWFAKNGLEVSYKNSPNWQGVINLQGSHIVLLKNVELTSTVTFAAVPAMVSTNSYEEGLDKLFNLVVSQEDPKIIEYGSYPDIKERLVNPNTLEFDPVPR